MQDSQAQARIWVNDHKTNGCNERIEIEAHPSPNGAWDKPCYTVTIDDGQNGKTIDVRFQHGPIKEVGVNGLTNEVLLAIVIDRLRGFQSGPFSCRENAIALTKVEESLLWMHKRTLGRVERGVEGTSVV